MPPRSKTAAFYALVIGVGAAVLLHPAAVSRGIKNGLALCAGVVIPSLFPFMVLSGLIALSGAGGWLSRLIWPVTRHLLRLPPQAGSAWVMSLLGGYPVGARTLAAMVQAGQLDRQSAQRMLPFCVNAGPAFLVTAVGAGFLGWPALGWLLLAAQVLVSLTMGTWLGRGQPLPPARPLPPPVPAGQALVMAVQSACQALLSSCGFVVLFSGADALLGALGLYQKAGAWLHLSPGQVQWAQVAASGLLEVTGGCANAAALGGEAAFLFMAFFLAFGGLSIHCQVAALVQPCGIGMPHFLRLRLLAGALNTAVCFPVYRALCQLMPTFSTQVAPRVFVSPSTAMGGVCLLCMAAILLAQLPLPGRARGQ